MRKKATTKKTSKRLSRGLHVVQKGKKYQVIQQPTAGKPTVQKIFGTKKYSALFFR